ncbi:glycoside hydrolase family 2 TIM barrel-domain containing protein [Luteolibacter sp. Populi]|uniref:glycoside hydrolase family 2 TIM barrel-domain containing protein n=1 Tax=Luteolibacter sp. Populi TaxID=3230487 RepID=UPI003466D064
MRILPLILCLPLLAPSAIAETAGRITMRRAIAGWELVKDGKPFVFRGAGGQGHLDVLAAAGGNSIRTWGIDALGAKSGGKALVDEARECGLTIAAGIWVGHERHGFDYSDPAQLEKQRQQVRAAVAKWKSEPAIGIWGLGNEMEGPAADGKGSERIWKEIEVLAKIIKEEDPGRLVMTVIAGANPNKVKGVKEHCPSVDILGVNAYASAPGVGKAVKSVGWDKPLLLTEFGPQGHWEVPKTPWGAPVEPTSREKAAKYFTTQQTVIEESEGLCVGSFAFLWGQKQECTATWYGMFLKSGEKLPPVDAMARAWTGEWPVNRCPRVESFSAPAVVKAGEAAAVKMEVGDPNGDPVKIEWKIAAESTDRKEGGDAEAAPEEKAVAMKEKGANEWEFKVPAKAGAYRLFLIVRDGKGAASAENIPFKVE